MDVGTTTTAVVAARPLWNQTGIYLASGETYRITATGRWFDWFIPHGPGGDPSASFYMRLFERWRRMPSRPWFELTGALDCGMDSAFPIGAQAVYLATASGQLTCFANDVPGFYFNNRGQVTVSVVRVA